MQSASRFRVHLPAYDYLIYLRHNGFPSPLLDWTESPYIAAYFAYFDNITSDSVAIYAYIENPGRGKHHIAGLPMISVRGPYVNTCKTHFAQKAWYTIATKWSKDEKCHYFCAHSEVFERKSEEQDVLIKIIMPSTIRIDVLKELNDFNINHFTLFQNENSLIKALEIKEFDLKGA